MVPEEKPKQPEGVPEEGKMAENFYYPDDHADTEGVDYPISKACLKFSNTFGHDSYKRYNLWLIDESTIFYGSGISYHFYDMITEEERIFFSRDGGGIGSLCIHSSRKYYAVSEKGNSPNVYIYTYPEHKLYRILRKGTERSFSSCTFSQDGEMMATVGSSPDYLICIWDWRHENVLLKAKAFA
jgi:WD40 repeat protein